MFRDILAEMRLTYPYIAEPLECTCSGKPHWHGKVVISKGVGKFTGAKETPEAANEAAQVLLEQIKEGKE